MFGTDSLKDFLLWKAYPYLMQKMKKLLHGYRFSEEFLLSFCIMKTFWNKWCLLSEKTLEFFRHFCKFYNFVLLSYLYFTFLLLSDHVRFSFFFLSNLFSFFVMKRIRNSKHSFYPLCAFLFVFYYLSPRRNTAYCSNHNCYCSIEPVLVELRFYLGSKVSSY